MTCFNHNRLAAVGICKYCNKGLCEKCAVDLGIGLACINKCESQVKVMSELMERGVKTYKNQAALFLRYSILQFVVGGFSFLFGYIYQQIVYEWLACIFAAFGVIMYLYFRKQK